MAKICFNGTHILLFLVILYRLSFDIGNISGPAVSRSAVQKSDGQKWIIIALVSVNHVMHDSSVLDQKLRNIR